MKETPVQINYRFFQGQNIIKLNHYRYKMSGNTGPVKEGQRTETGQTLQLESVGQPIEVLCTEPETPMLDQEPPTNDFFILQDFWPVFKLLEIFGLFPCRKEINEKGGIQLKPIRWWIPTKKILGLSTLLFLPGQILQEHLKSSKFPTIILLWAQKYL